MILDEQHYLFRLYAAAMLEPQSNGHQLAALQHVFVDAEGAASVEEFVERTGGLFVLAQSAVLDRAWNLGECARRHGDPWLERAAAIEFRHAARALSHEALPVAVRDGVTESSGWRRDSGQWAFHWDWLLRSVVRVHTVDGETEALAVEVRAAMDALAELDSEFLRAARYHRRLPWDVAMVEEWLRPYWRDPRPGNVVSAPEMDRMRTEWFAALRKFSGPIPAARPLIPVEAPPPSQDVLLRQQVWPDAVLKDHALETARQWSEASTASGREAVAVERALDYSVLAARHSLEFTALLSPLKSRVIGDRAAIQRTDAWVKRSMGLTHEQILAMPAVQAFLEFNLRPNLERDLDGFGSLHGEVGADLLMAVRARMAIDEGFDPGFVIPSTKE